MQIRQSSAGDAVRFSSSLSSADSMLLDSAPYVDFSVEILNRTKNRTILICTCADERIPVHRTLYVHHTIWKSRLFAAWLATGNFKIITREALASVELWFTYRIIRFTPSNCPDFPVSIYGSLSHK